MTNEWTKVEHALEYLRRLEDIPHRREGEATLIAEVPKSAKRILDLGCGDGHLLALLLAHCETATGIGLDFSPTMLKAAEQRFADDPRATLVMHNLDAPLPDLGSFDVVASSFAIHHCVDDRKREIYREVCDLLTPGGIFCNLEHVASPNDRVHQRFLDAMGINPQEEDPSNKLLDVETQLRWLRELGYEDVDCYWKWRELALLIGRKPGQAC
jgi:SAM-dependent methyltransferase